MTIVELGRTEVIVDRFESFVGVETVSTGRPESQERELSVGIIPLNPEGLRTFARPCELRRGANGRE